ncbi:MAG: outer membrane beta-barrel protein [Acidobacteriota bacterium]
MRHLGPLLFAPIPLLGQNISVGVRAGVPLTNLVETAQSPNLGFNSQTRRYVVGPTLEVRLPLGFGFHMDALYRRVSVDGFGPGATPTLFTGSFSKGHWHFPILLKYRFGAGSLRPFVSGGPSFNRLSGVGEAGHCVLTFGRRCGVEAVQKSSTGFALGAGLDSRLPFIRLAPEIRYTRVGADILRSVQPDLLRSLRDQFEFLLGITF